MGYLPYNNITEASGSHFRIQKQSGSVIFHYNESWQYSDERYTDFCSDYTGSYDSVLVGGLGIGVIPQWFAQEKNAQVTVIEQDQELIDEVVSQGYLSSSISFIQGDIFTHTETGSYDMVLFDIWWDESELTQEVQDELNTAYSGSSQQIVYPLNNL